MDVERGKSVAKSITLDTVADGEYGEVVEIESSCSHKDAIKSLDWEDTHRNWDREKERWQVDLDSVDRVIEELTDAGNTVSVRNEVLMFSDSTSYNPSDGGDEIEEYSRIGETEEKEIERIKEVAREQQQESD